VIEICCRLKSHFFGPGGDGLAERRRHPDDLLAGESEPLGQRVGKRPFVPPAVRRIVDLPLVPGLAAGEPRVVGGVAGADRERAGILEDEVLLRALVRSLCGRGLLGRRLFGGRRRLLRRRWSGLGCRRLGRGRGRCGLLAAAGRERKTRTERRRTSLRIAGQEPNKGSSSSSVVMSIEPPIER
jgi:hypothetical protein